MQRNEAQTSPGEKYETARQHNDQMHEYEDYRAGKNDEDEQLLAFAPCFAYGGKNRTRDATRAKAADLDCARTLNRLKRIPHPG